jgi:sugar/nucleoside kinase (ribokinase family)
VIRNHTHKVITNKKRIDMSKKYDITFVGHMCYDEIKHFGQEAKVAPGSAVLCGAMVAARVGKKVAAVVKMSPDDEEILQPMKDIGIDTYLIPAEETSYNRVVHESDNMDERTMTLIKSAGIIDIKDVPELDSTCVHLAGISDTEFDMPLMKGLKARNYQSLSVDMQSFVRHIDPVTKNHEYSDVADKKEIAAMMDKLKLDVLEAKLLTGTDDLEKAAKIIESWGCSDIMITQSEGVLARVDGKTYYEKFSNSNVSGRTGRGDTTFVAYLSHRLDHGIAESVKFAAALVSIKMETPGPFSGTLEEVYRRIEEKHS